MRRVPDLRIQVAPLIVSPILSRRKISRRGLARGLHNSMLPEVPIRSRIFAPGGCPSQVAGAVTGSSDNTNILLAVEFSHAIEDCNLITIIFMPELTYPSRSPSSLSHTLPLLYIFHLAFA